MNDPELKRIFAADYCVTELGGASIPDFKLQPTPTFFQGTSEKGWLSFAVAGATYRHLS